MVLDGPNGGYGKAVNRGFDASTGEFIAIVEPDDYIDESMMEDLYRKAYECDLDFVKADFYRFTHDKTGRVNLAYNKLDYTGSHYEKVFNPSEEIDSYRFTMNTWCGIYRKSFLASNAVRHHETPGASFQDNGFYFQTFMHAKKAMIIGKPFYYNRRDNPGSSVKSSGKVEALKVEFDWIENLIREARLWDKLKGPFWWRKYRGYLFRLENMDKSYYKKFINAFAAEFDEAERSGDLDLSFFSGAERASLHFIRKHPKIYCRFTAIKPTKSFRSICPEPVKNVAKRLLWRSV